jgi:hypothetical protein
MNERNQPSNDWKESTLQWMNGINPPLSERNHNPYLLWKSSILSLQKKQLHLFFYIDAAKTYTLIVLKLLKPRLVRTFFVVLFAGFNIVKWRKKSDPFVFLLEKNLEMYLIFDIPPLQKQEESSCPGKFEGVFNISKFLK